MTNLLIEKKMNPNGMLGRVPEISGWTKSMDRQLRGKKTKKNPKAEALGWG
jgi:hypothetical protein